MGISIFAWLSSPLLICYGRRSEETPSYLLPFTDMLQQEIWGNSILLTPLYWYVTVGDLRKVHLTYSPLLICYGRRSEESPSYLLPFTDMLRQEIWGNSILLTPLYWYVTVGDLRKLHLTYSPLLICYGRRSEETPSYLLPFTDMLRQEIWGNYSYLLPFTDMLWQEIWGNSILLTPLYWYVTAGDLRKLHLTYSPLLICYGRRSEETPSYLLPFTDMLRQEIWGNSILLTPLYWYVTAGDLRKLHLTYSPLLICYGRRSEETPSYLLPFTDMLW